MIAAGGAPGWIIVPAIVVLVFAFLVLKAASPRPSIGEIVWDATWSVAGLAAFGALAWWAGSVFGIAS